MHIPHVGDTAPPFSLPDQDETVHTLKEYSGKWVVLYFYPKDDTPGCTKEACGFRDAFANLKKEGVVILGVSKDSPGRHTKFREKYQLPFTLLADEEGKTIEQYGAWKEKSMYGKTFLGIARITVLIDPDGKVAKVYENVKPAEHAEEILRDVQGMKK